jgi:MFS family permease
MVAVMSITPVHLHDGHHAIGVVGTVMSGHFVGMFALAPLVGWVVDRLGVATAIRLGMGVLGAGAAAAALMPLEHGTALSMPLLVIGLGWCICFVAASVAVASAVHGPQQQGRIDSIVWIGSASASIAAGITLAQQTYAAVAWAAVAAVVVMAVFVASRVSQQKTATATA